MRTGKLSISRGHQLEPAPAPRLALVPAAAPELAAVEPPCAPEPDYRLVHDRLTALERLTRLAEQGALTAEEFVAEKALVLGRAPAEVLPGAAAATPARGPSLLGRLFSWKFLPVGLAAGLAFSFASQPQETTRIFDEALRLLGV